MGTVIGLVHPNVVAAFTQIHADYARMLDEQPAPWSDMIVEVTQPSPTLVDQFMVDLSTGGFRPWTGDRQMRDVAQHSFTVVKEPFEDSVNIPKILAMNATFQSIARSEAQRFAANKITFRDKLARKVLQAGASTPCWDGSNFFSVSHQVNVRDASKGTYSNLIVSGDGLDLVPSDWATVKALAESVVAPNGDTYGAQVTGLLYPSAVEPKVRALFGKAFLAGGESNEYFDDIDSGSRKKVVDLNNQPTVVYVVLSVTGRAKPLPYVETDMNTMTLGEESEHCGKTGYVAELADFHASMGMANPRLLLKWTLG